METSCLLLLFGVMTSLMSVITVKGEGSDFFDKLNCSENENICDEDKHQVCDTSTKKCRCETETLWKKISDKCVKQEELFQKCGSKVADPEVHCVVPGSKCILTDFSEPRMSCMCNTPDYVDIPNPGGTPVSEVYKDICGK
ncbi:hypothetical protein LSH36_1240g00018 [Paralvinella palmiformis]|uniref:Uncharacterized protein n=1 Tax=Paralvinella palmiformis TaxID=53620 RepID=A0AAD9MPN6_9ANNE|nr:hypothetical protein LSH36_1240g00018 [Paralvinella palmiformis]